MTAWNEPGSSWRSSRLVPIAWMLVGCSGGEEALPPDVYTAGEPVEHLGVAALEPAVVEHPSGAVFVSGWGESDVQPLLWKSLDGGVGVERRDTRYRRRVLPCDVPRQWGLGDVTAIFNPSEGRTGFSWREIVPMAK